MYHVGTLKKEEIEAVPNIGITLIKIAWFTLRRPSGEFFEILKF